MAKGIKTGGRKAGTPNKVSADVRACVALIAQNLVGEAEDWIRRGAKKQPLKAAQVLGQLLEYHIPKISRIEHTGHDGGPLQVSIIDPTRRGDAPQSVAV